MPGLEDLGLAVVARDLDAAFAQQLPAARHPGHAVRLKERRDAARELPHHLVLVHHHGRHIEACALDPNAMDGDAIAQVGVELGRFEQRLRRDAADVQAGAAERGVVFDIAPLVHARNLQPELRRADRGHIARGSGADHDDIKAFGHLS